MDEVLTTAKTLGEVKDAKRDLERRISDLIRDYTKTYDVRVADVLLTPVTNDLGYFVYHEVEVRVEL